MKSLDRIFDALASLKLAVVVILGFTVSLAAATFLESARDTPTAQYYVYQSPFFYGLLTLLGINIFFSAMSRWPWERRHIPFLTAHLGIITLLVGSFLTYRFGIDGSLRIEEGQVTGVVELPEHQIVLGLDSRGYTLPFPWIPPDKEFRETPLQLSDFPEAASANLKVTRYLSRAEPVYSFVPSEVAMAGLNPKPALQFRVEGGPGSPMAIRQNFWLWKGDTDFSKVQAGPAVFVFDDKAKVLAEKPEAGRPSLYFYSDGREFGVRAVNSSGQEKRQMLRGQYPISIDTGFKNVKITVEQYIPSARPHTEYVPAKVQYGPQAPPPALYLVAGSGGPGKELWLGVGDRAQLKISGKSLEIGYFPRRVILPFSLRLERFDVQYYPGSRDPKEYSSLVKVLSASQKTGTDTSQSPLTSSDPILISMNEPLYQQGMTFYQASFEDGKPRPTASILSVNQDPGRFMKYLGSLLLVLGSMLLFARRLGYFKRWLGEPGNSRVERETAGKVATSMAALTVALGILSPVPALADPAPKSGLSFQELGRVPVQTGGRIKPLDSWARESVLAITGSRKFKNWDPVELVLSWVTDPPTWENSEFIQITREDVKRQLGISETRKHFSPQELIAKSALAQYADKLPNPQAQVVSSDEKLAANSPQRDQREKELKLVLERMGLYRAILTGEAWQLVPPAPEDATPDQWKNLLAHFRAQGDQMPKSEVSLRFIELIKAYQGGDGQVFESASKLLRISVQKSAADFTPSLESKLSLELSYNRMRPHLWAWMIYLLAFVCLVMGQRKVGIAAWFIAFGIHVAAMTVRSIIAERPPVSNMYESIVWVAFGVSIFGGILYFIQKQKQVVVPAASCAIACLGLIAADAAPTVMDPGIHPLVPVLRSNLWLTVHVLTITLGYAAFALSWGIANVTLGHYFQKALSRTQPAAQKVSQLNQLTYRAMQFGVVLLAAGTILGGVWADYSWGRFWGWDPKEVWALIALLCYVAILHGRFAGWIKAFGFPAWTIISFISVVMAWYGVNFVLGVGKHAYGFASGGLGVVTSVVLAQLVWVIVVALSHKRLKPR